MGIELVYRYVEYHINDYVGYRNVFVSYGVNM